MICRTCGAEVPAPDADHDIVYRLNNPTEGPGPFPFLVLHRPVPGRRPRPLRDDDPVESD